MQIAPEQGAFMTLLARAIGARRAIEVGTFTGYSALCLARGLPDDGRADRLRRERGVDRDRAALLGEGGRRREDRPADRSGRARRCARCPRRSDFDLAFIDADKPSYPIYYELILARLRSGGLILVDNVLWMGQVANPAATDAQTAGDPVLQRRRRRATRASTA